MSYFTFQAQNLGLCLAYRRCSIHISGVEINQIKHQQKKLCQSLPLQITQWLALLNRNIVTCDRHPLSLTYGFPLCEYSPRFKKKNPKRKMYTDVLATVVITVKNWKQSKCLTGKWLSKQWDYYIAIKNDRGENCQHGELCTGRSVKWKKEHRLAFKDACVHRHEDQRPIRKK